MVRSTVVKGLISFAMVVVSGISYYQSFAKKAELVEMIANDAQVGDSYLVNMMLSQAQDLTIMAVVAAVMAVGFFIAFVTAKKS